MPNDVLTLADVEAAVSAVVQPLREQLRLVEGRERLILADLAETREMKSRLLQTLRKLDPSMTTGKPGPKPGSNGHVAPAKFDQRIVDEVQTYVDKVAPLNPDGFTRTRVHKAMQEDGHGLGDKRVVMAMEALHTSGYLTLHKLVTGGNKSYKRTEDLNGEPRPAN